MQAADRLEQLTAGCSPREIDVLTLRRQGLTHVEIAKRIGMDESSVRRILKMFQVAAGGPAMMQDTLRPAIAPDRHRWIEAVDGDGGDTGEHGTAGGQARPRLEEVPVMVEQRLGMVHAAVPRARRRG